MLLIPSTHPPLDDFSFQLLTCSCNSVRLLQLHLKMWTGVWLLTLFCQLPYCFSSPSSSVLSPSPSYSNELTSKTRREAPYYSGQSPVVHQELSHYYDESGNQLYYKDAYQHDPNILYESPSYSPDAATAYAGHGGYYEGYATDPYYERDPYYQYPEESEAEEGTPLIENVMKLLSRLTPTFGLDRQDDGDEDDDSDEEDDDYDDDDDDGDDGNDDDDDDGNNPLDIIIPIAIGITLIVGGVVVADQFANWGYFKMEVVKNVLKAKDKFVKDKMKKIDKHMKDKAKKVEEALKYVKKLLKKGLDSIVGGGDGENCGDGGDGGDGGSGGGGGCGDG